MRLAPVKSITRPAYPPQQVTSDHPELLSRLPLRWQRCRKATVAAGLVATLGVTLTLPGCIGAPTVRLVTESEAAAVIQSDMMKYGLDPVSDYNFSENGSHIAFVWHSTDSKDFYLTALQDKNPDLYDEQRNVGVEFYSGSQEKYALSEMNNDNQAHPEKGESVVLVIDYYASLDGIHKQVTDFLDWLKSEGII